MNHTAPISPFPKNVYKHNARIWKIMANAKRLEILNTLRKQPCTVESLCKVVGASKPNISQHLAVLRNCRLVEPTQRGRNVQYSIVDPRIVEPCRVLKKIFGL